MEKPTSNIDASPPGTQHDGASKSGSEADPKVDYSNQPTTKTNYGDYWRVFSYSTTLDRILLAVAFFGQIGTGSTLPLMNIVFGKLTTNFAAYFTPGSTTTKAQFIHSLNQQTLYIVYLFIARWVLIYMSMFVFRMVGLRMSAKIRLEYLRALFALSITTLDTLPTGQASNTITATANTLQIGISEKLGTLVQFIALGVTAVVVAFKYNWLLTLVTSTVLVFIVLVYGTIVPIIMKLTKRVEQADEKASSIAGEVLGSVRMIMACGAQGRVAKKYAGWIDESTKRGLKMSPFIAAQYAPLFFSIYAAMALCFWYGFKLYLEHKIASIGTIVIVLMSTMMITFSLGQTAAPIVAVGKAANAATDFFAVIDAPKPATTGLREPDVSAREDITLDSVTFAYPSRPHVKVLDSLSVRFETGKITAIVGASGSGKSTIVGLLERFYDLDDEKTRFRLPKSAVKDQKDIDKEKDIDEVSDSAGPAIPLSGTISIGNTSLDAVDLRWWRSQIGLVQQEPFIFNDTIRKNVEYGLVGSEWEHADAATKMRMVEEACKEAFADEFITRLPMGYETQVGDAGIKLSGGQRQRLAIARSIVKRPKILILDEATSSIDVRGERLVQAALDKVSEGLTTISIAHRLSTIRKADKIVVLQKGRLIEQGNHESLLANEDGAYWALVNAQKLSMGEGFADDTDLEEQTKREELIRTLSAAESATGADIQDYKPKGLINSFGLLLFEQRARWPWYSILIVGCMGAALGNPIQAYLFSQLINVITLTSASALQTASSHWAIRYIILASGTAMAYFMLGWSSNVVSVHITSTYRQQYFESILAKPVKFFDQEDSSSGTLTARVANDPTQIQQLLGINMAMVYIAIFSLIGCIIIALDFGWKLTLVALFVAAPLIMCCAFYRVRYELQFEAMNQAVFAESSKFASESIGAFRTVASLTLEEMICKRYEELLQLHVNKAFKKARFSTIIFAMSDSMSLLCMAMTFYYGGRLLAIREYTSVQFFVVYIAVVNGAEGAGSLLSFGPNMAQASAAANRILSFRAPKSSQERSSLEEIPNTEGGIEISLRDVWFKYPTRDTPIFSGLSLTIEKGQFAALVGPSGCGKTSIISLLERFYEPSKGNILCNSTNISQIDIATYRKYISLVAQEPTLFQGSIRENVLLGVDEDTPTEALHHACRQAEIHDFVMSLPDGYNTDVGSKGIALSGGQKQRIAIARALIRNPSILLLDEATSSLDSESEKLVQAAFERAGKGRTMVVVAHRLATVQNADVIFVLGEGRVLEKGTHQTLLRQKGVYYQMCQSQALDR